MTTREELRKMMADGEAVVASLEASIKTNEASLDTLLAKRKQTEMRIERLRRGDDLRTILIEDAGSSLEMMGELVDQTRAGLEQQRTQYEHATNYLRSVRDSIEG